MIRLSSKSNIYNLCATLLDFTHYWDHIGIGYVRFFLDKLANPQNICHFKEKVLTVDV